MARVIFIQPDGESVTLEASMGRSVMEIAVQESVPGIIGECGGSVACGTCHVHVDRAWVDRLPRMDAMERDMLDATDDVDETSRLSCQIGVNDALDGIVIRVPRH